MSKKPSKNIDCDNDGDDDDILVDVDLEHDDHNVDFNVGEASDKKQKFGNKRIISKSNTNQLKKTKKPQDPEDDEEDNGDNEKAVEEKKSFTPFMTIDDGPNDTTEEDPKHLINVKSVNQCELIFF